MKMLRCLFAIALVYGISGVAKADPLDFQMVVIDPPPPPSSFTTFVLLPGTTSFTLPFSACAPGELPSGTKTYDGCLALLNSTGNVLTSLEVSFVPTEAFTGQQANCALDGVGDVFHTTSCNPDPVNGLFLLDFTIGEG
jgi:hypothetical protein